LRVPQQRSAHFILDETVIKTLKVSLAIQETGLQRKLASHSLVWQGKPLGSLGWLLHRGGLTFQFLRRLEDTVIARRVFFPTKQSPDWWVDCFAPLAMTLGGEFLRRRVFFPTTCPERREGKQSSPKSGD
jgi:hypothetical protein